MNQEKSVIIVRGVSGSGKSSFANLIGSPYIVSADDYFMEDGEYKFNAQKLPEAHQFCEDQFAFLIASEKSPIVVDNTNTNEKEFGKYIDFAKKAGYKVFSIIVENRHGNSDIHGVPEYIKRRQKSKILNDISL